MPAIDFRQYAITDRRLLPPEKFFLRIAELLRSGNCAIQIREKDLSARELIGFVENIQRITEKHYGKIFINDRADIAQALHADGLHLPEHGLPVYEARKIVGNILIGKSTHSIEAATKAETEGADFITFGPIYDTPSKRNYGAPLGVQKLKEVVNLVSIPVFAIGGITAERGEKCRAIGAFGTAGISSYFQNR